MKTKFNIKSSLLSQTLLFASLLIISLNVKAQQSSNQIFLKESDRSSFLLYLPQATQDSFKVLIKDFNGRILHHETLGKGIDQRKYNFKNLASGNYLLAVSYEKTTQWLNIHKEDGCIMLDQNKLQTIIEPSFLQHDEYLDMNMLCFSDAKLMIRIWDLEGHLLSEEHLQANGSIEKRYNFKSLKNGAYRLEISLEKAGLDWEYVQTINWNQDKHSTINSYANK